MLTVNRKFLQALELEWAGELDGADDAAVQQPTTTENFVSQDLGEDLNPDKITAFRDTGHSSESWRPTTRLTRLRFRTRLARRRKEGTPIPF